MCVLLRLAVLLSVRPPAMVKSAFPPLLFPSFAPRPIFYFTFNFCLNFIISFFLYCFGGACHYLTNHFQMEAPVAPSRSLQEGYAKPSWSVSSRRLRGASKAPPRTLRGGLRTLRGGCTYRRLHEDALEGSRGLGYTILRATMILIYNIGT